jgi:dUTP pyrophosphatase
MFDWLAVKVRNWLDVPVKIEFMKLAPNAKMPHRAKPTDAGFDIYALHDFTIQSRTVRTVHTGVAFVAPPGWYYTIEGRSGSWKHGIVPCRGIMDSTYSGEIMVAVHNHGPDHFTIAEGERFAQLTVHKYVPIEIVEVDKVSDSYAGRGAAGHGSTGR